MIRIVVCMEMQINLICGVLHVQISAWEDPLWSGELYVSNKTRYR